MLFTFRTVTIVIFCSILLSGCEKEKTPEEPRLRSVKFQEIKTNILHAVTDADFYRSIFADRLRY